MGNFLNHFFVNEKYALIARKMFLRKQKVKESNNCRHAQPNQDGLNYQNKTVITQI